MQILSSPYGPIELFACGDPAVVARLQMDASLNTFRPSERQQEALVEIANLPNGCLSFARLAHRLIGYATFHSPDSFERWSRTTVPGLLELGAVETSSTHRGRHLARKLLEVSFNTGRFEDKIVIATIYQWHFDLEHSGLTAHGYRKLLERLYASVGFEVVKTDDPEVMESPNNALMARIGPRAPKALQDEFARLRFLDSGKKI